MIARHEAHATPTPSCESARRGAGFGVMVQPAGDAPAVDERVALIAAVAALLDALDGQPTSHEAWMLQVGEGLGEAAQRLRPYAPSAPCGAADRSPACAAGAEDAGAHARLLRDLRALESLVADPRLRLVVSTAAVRRRVLRLTVSLAAHASGP